MRRLNDLPLLARLLGGFGLVLAVLALVVAIAAGALRHASAETREVAELVELTNRVNQLKFLTIELSSCRAGRPAMPSTRGATAAARWRTARSPGPGSCPTRRPRARRSRRSRSSTSQR
jgi:hypothetical protein